MVTIAMRIEMVGLQPKMVSRFCHDRLCVTNRFGHPVVARVGVVRRLPVDKHRKRWSSVQYQLDVFLRVSIERQYPETDVIDARHEHRFASCYARSKQ